jgi:NAD(P) transhydrogenase subunit alpha
MIVGVPKETFPGETRVSLVPAALGPLSNKGLEIMVEAGAGTEAGYGDHLYHEKGATIASSRTELFSRADVITQVRALGANPEAGRSDLELMRDGQIIIGTCDPLVKHEANRALAGRGVSLLSLELMPRITRAQSMDILSSMATIAGYKAVLMAANTLPKMFPMMMTAAGTISPARVFVVGAGVAGLQAIASAKKLGAVVEAYDVRPAVKEQVESLGGKFVELELETGDAEDAGGYAKAMDEEFYRKQREMMIKVVAANDVVITTAAVPGKKAPTLVTEEMVRGMQPGSVIVDLAAERGGNCEMTRPGETVKAGGVTILGPLNVPATIPFHASQMFSKNVATFLLHLVHEGAVQLDPEDEITAGTLVVHQGKIVHPMVSELMEDIRGVGEAQ